MRFFAFRYVMEHRTISKGEKERMRTLTERYPKIWQKAQYERSRHPDSSR